MSEFKVIKTTPGDTQELFENLPKDLYEPDSMRFQLGNDPVITHLEGCYVLLKDDLAIGRFAFYENPQLKYENESVACIGSYECIEEQEASTYLIEHAIFLAKSKGYGWLIGPMEGSTWHNYRFSKHNDEVNFFMEPYHHIYYNHQFIHAGFKEVADYYSNRDQTLNCNDEQLDKFEKHYLDKGAVFRHLNMDNLKKDLRKLAQLSLDGFANNFLFSPITVEDFVTKYEQFSRFFDPSLVWIAEDAEGELQAFIFAIKDHMDSSGETMIIKSMARKQTSPFRGIGSYLAGKVNQMAQKMGYKQVIHALMIRDNASMRISEKYTGDEYKSYALYGVKL